jgi:AcrR family transcriptional regulator
LQEEATMTDDRSTGDRILDAALELLYERGYEGTTTRAISESAGVNEVTLFRKFGSKRDLFFAVIDRETDIAEHLTDDQFAFSGDLETDLLMAGQQMTHHMMERGKLIKIVMMEATRDPDIWLHVSKTPFAILGFITRYFESLRDQGKVRDIDPYLMSVGFFSFFFRTMVTNAFLGSDVFMEMDDEAIEGFVDMYINGIRKEA